MEGTYLEGLGEDAVRVTVRELLKNSIFYAAALRCGLDPMEYLEEGDFVGITDFNTPAALASIGKCHKQPYGAASSGHRPDSTEDLSERRTESS